VAPTQEEHSEPTPYCTCSSVAAAEADRREQCHCQHAQQQSLHAAQRWKTSAHSSVLVAAVAAVRSSRPEAVAANTRCLVVRLAVAAAGTDLVADVAPGPWLPYADGAPAHAGEGVVEQEVVREGVVAAQVVAGEPELVAAQAPGVVAEQMDRTRKLLLTVLVQTDSQVVGQQEPMPYLVVQTR